MDKEKSELHFFEKDYTYLNGLIEKWYASLQKEEYCLAISRKAPRLLDWCRMQYNNSGESGPVVISELALPFIKTAGESSSGRCVVVDEAIYHGTTFKKVLSLAKHVFADITARPLVFSIEAMLSKEIRSYLDSWEVIDDRFCPFFINTIIYRFLTLGKPYDIEYPLFYMELDGLITKEVMEQYMEKLAEIESVKRRLGKKSLYYSTKTYSREKKESYSAFTYLTEYLYTHKEGRAKPDFSKLRFFYRENVLCVASMSPHVLSEADMQASNGMLSGDLAKVWSVIQDAVCDLDVVDEEFKYQAKKSLVVMTNYLLSFANFLLVKESIQEVFPVKTKHISMDLTDLTYLVGPKVAKDVKALLDSYLSESRSFQWHVTPTPLSSDVVYSQIPINYQGDYAVSMSSDNLGLSDFKVESMISNMFSAMHWNIEIPSRRDPMEGYSRLRFGESYLSIQSRLALAQIDQAKLRTEIHQALDARIDNGSAVPNYIRKEAMLSDSYWIRMFRSGENEDFRKDQILRQLIAVFKAFLKFNKGTIIHRYELEFILVLLSNRNPDWFGAPLKVKFCKDMYQTFVLLGEEEIGLVDYAMSYHVLKIDEQQFLRLENTSYVEKLSLGTLGTKEQDTAVDDCAEYVHAFVQENRNPLLIREVLNYLYYKTPSYDYAVDFNHWKKTLIVLIENDELVDWDVKSADFIDLFNRLPEPYLNIVEQINSGNPVVKEISGWLFSVIKNYNVALRREHTFEKLMLSYYLLNLWNYYKEGFTASNFNADKYKHCLLFLENAGETGMYNWLMGEGSMERIQSSVHSEVQARLVGMLEKSC